MKKTIIVVGAGSGLGNGVAEKFGMENFRVILIARNQEHLKKYAEEFETKKIEVHTIAADASDFERIAEVFNDITNRYGTPDVLFYNAGITIPDAEVNINADVLVKRYAIDVAGAFNCIKLIDTPEFAEKKGAVLITNGIFAVQPHADYLPLSMDKAALRAMIQALAPVYKEKGIFIGSVQIRGIIGSSEHFEPKNIAKEFWKLYENRDSSEIIYSQSMRNRKEYFMSSSLPKIALGAWAWATEKLADKANINTIRIWEKEMK